MGSDRGSHHRWRQVDPQTNDRRACSAQLLRCHAGRELEVVYWRARLIASAAAAVLAEDAPDGAVGAPQAELLFKASGAERGDRVPGLEGHRLDLGCADAPLERRL